MPALRIMTIATPEDIQEALAILDADIKQECFDFIILSGTEGIPPPCGSHYYYRYKWKRFSMFVLLHAQMAG